jgi:hypothetical protein
MLRFGACKPPPAVSPFQIFRSENWSQFWASLLKPKTGFIYLFVLPGHKAEPLKPISGFNFEAQNGLQFWDLQIAFFGPEARQKFAPPAVQKMSSTCPKPPLNLPSSKGPLLSWQPPLLFAIAMFWQIMFL